jgi:Zn-dependent protease
VRGAFRLFNFAGITVYLHFTWFIVALFEINSARQRYYRPLWAAVEYVALFGIVLLHEFGHAFACRSTGGRADRIVLWPLGGLAFVDPPLRPGAVLWSIAAGPLVNVLLFPLFLGAVLATSRHGLFAMGGDIYRFFRDMFFINAGLLVFNLLPFYPLDGGQIVRALLWFKFGPIRSLQTAAIIGVIGAALLAILAFTLGSIWTGILAFFIFSQAGAAFQRANEMKLEAEVAARQQPPTAPT